MDYNGVREALTISRGRESALRSKSRGRKAEQGTQADFPRLSAFPFPPSPTSDSLVGGGQDVPDDAIDVETGGTKSISPLVLRVAMPSPLLVSWRPSPLAPSSFSLR